MTTPSSTVTSIAQVSGQSCGQAPRTSVGAAGSAMAMRVSYRFRGVPWGIRAAPCQGCAQTVNHRVRETAVMPGTAT